MITSEERKLLHILDVRFMQIWAEAWGKGDSGTMFQGETPEEANRFFLKSKGPWVDFVHSIGAEFMQDKHDLTGVVFVPDPHSSRQDRLSIQNGVKQPLWVAVPRELALKILALGELP